MNRRSPAFRPFLPALDAAFHCRDPLGTGHYQAESLTPSEFANVDGFAVSNSAGEAMQATGPGETDRTDEHLVRRVVAGERAAFDALVERYQKRATSVSFRLVGNIHDALEVVQDAFVRAYRGIESLEEPARFGSWLLRIVTNLSLNFRRDRAVGGRKISLSDCVKNPEDGGDPPVEDSPASENRPGAVLAATELSEVVQKAIDELPEQQRVALVLFSIEAMPQKDVAGVMGCSVEAVKWHVFQARRKLKERLADYL